jgi:hypothetical protein
MSDKPFNFEKAYKKQDDFRMQHKYSPISTPCCGHCESVTFEYEGEVNCQKIDDLTPDFMGIGISATCVCDLFKKAI